MPGASAVTGRSRVADGAAKWADLRARLISAALLSALAGAALWGGAIPWIALVTAICCIMLWELGPLCERGLEGARRFALALLPLPGVVLGLWLASGGLLALVLVPLAGIAILRAGRGLWLAYSTLLLAGALALAALGAEPARLLALIAVVVISDTAGYFAGRILGGPKFWPRVSPKKTWSGTIAGWLGAALFGTLAAPALGIGAATSALLAALLAFAGQMGDAAESAMKRKAGVKDASNLIPGHGGFLDRLDALIAASALAGLIALLYAL